MRRDKAQVASELVNSARQQAEATRYEAAANGAATRPQPPEMATAYGFPIPREVTEAERQVQLAVRIPESLRWAVKMASLMTGVEMQALVEEALAEKLERLARG